MINCHVDVADVALLQRPHVGDPVADHLVHGRAATLGELKEMGCISCQTINYLSKDITFVTEGILLKGVQCCEDLG